MVGTAPLGSRELLQSQVAKWAQNLHLMGSHIPRRPGNEPPHTQLLVPDLDRKAILPHFTDGPDAAELICQKLGGWE